MQHFFDFMLNNWLLFAALLVILILLAMTTVRSRLLGFNEIKPNEAVQLMNHENPLLLDVRELDEFNKSHIIGATHIPENELENRIKEIETWMEKPILIICRTGQRSAKAASTLKHNSFKQLHKLDGGMMAWVSASLPVQGKR